MLKSNRGRLAVAICFALLAAGCGDDDSPTAPTNVEPEPEPEPITLTGTWSGMVDGVLVDGDATAMLTQDGSAVSGEWSMPMPAPLVLAGAPADVDLAGPVTGMVTDMTAELSFGFLAAFAPYFGNTECAIDVTVTSFDETTMEGTWETNASCEGNVNDMGTLTFTR